MRHLLLSSCVLLLLACGKSPYRNLQAAAANSSCLDKFKPDFTSVLYNTQVNVVGKHLSGLLLFKKMPDSTIRVLFSNEMGVKFFDFAYTKTGFKVEYCIKQLNRKAAIKELQKVIGLLLMYKMNPADAVPYTSGTESYFKVTSGNEANYFITDPKCHQLIRIENASKRSKKIHINLSPYKAGMPDSAYIAHESFEFNINLKQLQR